MLMMLFYRWLLLGGLVAGLGRDFVLWFFAIYPSSGLLAALD
jgi:hypothetical protein